MVFWKIKYLIKNPFIWILSFRTPSTSATSGRNNNPSSSSATATTEVANDSSSSSDGEDGDNVLDIIGDLDLSSSSSSEAISEEAEGARLYMLMCRCWNMEPQKRPAFRDLVQELQVGN